MSDLTTKKLNEDEPVREPGPYRPRPEDDVVPSQRKKVIDNTSGFLGLQEFPSDKEPCYDGAVLDIRGLTKVYGNQVAVNELFMRLFPGDILGFLGPNGAGKTTTLRMLATVLAADAGQAYIQGHPLAEVEQVRARVGYMPDFLGVYDDLLVNEYLEFFARAYKISAHHREFVIKEALETTRLTALENNPVDGLSRGQKQRLGLARLLMHDPALLLLDEPAAGLDPRARVDLRDILRGLQKRGKAMIVSSHILSDLADFCNKIAILVGGKLLVFQTTDKLIDQLHGQRRLKLRLLDRSEEVRQLLSQDERVSDLQFQGEELVFEYQGHNAELAALNRRLVEAGYDVSLFSEEPRDLQDIYLQVTEGTYSD